MRLLHEHNEIVRAALASHDGREVKHTGDGIMASFTSVASAVAFARGSATRQLQDATSKPPHRST